MGLGAWTRWRYNKALKICGIPSKMPNEWHEQQAIITWYRELWPQHYRALRVSMNGLNLGGGRKAARMISQMRAQGMVDGEADIAIMLPTEAYGGLIIEHKALGSKHDMTEGQRDYLQYHRDIGNQAFMTRGVEEAKEVIASYMALTLSMESEQ